MVIDQRGQLRGDCGKLTYVHRVGSGLAGSHTGDLPIADIDLARGRMRLLADRDTAVRRCIDNRSVVDPTAIDCEPAANKSAAGEFA